MGYTPLFDTMLTGTLYGRWPHTGIWACLLSRASREGVIDETPQSLAAAIGVPVDTLLACIADFMNPDPDSRSPEHEGRRLALIHEHRSWGWKVLNIGKYKEKARKKVYDDARTESGTDADRKRNVRTARDVPRCPDVSRDVPLSETETETETPRARASPAGAPAALVLHASLPATEWGEWLAFRRSQRWPLDAMTLGKQLKILARFDAKTQRQIIDDSIQAGWQGLFAPKGKPQAIAPPADAEDQAMHQAKALRAQLDIPAFRDPYPVESAAAYATQVKLAAEEAKRTSKRPVGAVVAQLAKAKRGGA